MLKYNFSGFTQKANEAINISIDTAEKMGHTYVGSEHLLIGISSVNDCSACRVLSTFGITSEKLMDLVKKSIGYGTKTNLNPDMLTPRAKHVIELAIVFARDSGKSFVGTEHILIGILNDGENYAQRLITDLNCSVQDILNFSINDSVSSIENSQKRDLKKNNKFKTQSIIDKYGRNLTEIGYKGELPKIIGREKEIQRVMQILSRKTKNNPCIIGDPGVGKTAIVEGIAQMIANNCAPKDLIGKKIIDVDLTSMVAGTKYRGDFEERVKSIISEAKENKDIILFIDEIHNIVGAGSAEGSTDAANMFKPSLARGELRVIGATTIEEYRKTIEKDAALERRFQKVIVEESTEEETSEILNGLRESFEKYHNVKINSNAISAAVSLSSRYINDRFLPDKAIDLIDEAAAALKLENLILPDELKKLYDELYQNIKKKESAIKTQDYVVAAKFRDEELRIKKLIDEKNFNTDKNPRLELNEENISQLVCDITKIPVNKLNESDSDRLLNLKSQLNSVVFGQNDAVETLSNAIIRARTGLKDPNRPIGCYLFLGPTGVGKTELCKRLAKHLFDSEDSLIRLDMSEYSEKHSISKLIGAPPGYIGYDNGGILCEKVRRKPYSVVLFDEIEKAHSDIFNLLLQIMDDGIITDSQGRRAFFKNAILVLTSNIGSDKIFGKNKTIGFQDSTVNETVELRNQIENTLKDFFKPEFLNRIDEFVLFNKLKTNDIKSICKAMLSELSERLKKQNINIEFSNSVIEQIVKEGYNIKYGARPLRRIIDVRIGDRISEAILTGELKSGDSVKMDYVNQFFFTKNI